MSSGSRRTIAVHAKSKIDTGISKIDTGIERITEKANEGESSNMSLAEKMFGDHNSSCNEETQKPQRATLVRKTKEEPQSATLKPTKSFADRKKFERPMMTQKAGTNSQKKFGFGTTEINAKKEISKIESKTSLGTAHENKVKRTSDAAKNATADIKRQSTLKQTSVR